MCRITTICYGKEWPLCHEENEKCWSENRRAGIVCSLVSISSSEQGGEEECEALVVRRFGHE
jgi:hypothetical protein